MAGNFEGIKNRRFGIEIEMTGITRCSAAKAIRDVLGGSVEHIGGSYDKYKIYDEDGRAWSIVSDASIDPYKKSQKESVHCRFFSRPMCRQSTIFHRSKPKNSCQTHTGERRKQSLFH